MLEVAARVRPELEWRRGDAADLPFQTETFDAVLCQSAIFFFPDLDRALAEMARVSRHGGVVALQTYAGLGDQAAYQVLDEIVRRSVSDRSLGLPDTYWSCGDLPALTAAMVRAGLAVAETRTVRGTAVYGTVDNLVETEIKGTPLVNQLSDVQIQQIREDAASALSSYITDERGLEMPITAHLVAAHH